MGPRGRNIMFGASGPMGRVGFFSGSGFCAADLDDDPTDAASRLDASSGTGCELPDRDRRSTPVGTGGGGAERAAPWADAGTEDAAASNSGPLPRDARSVRRRLSR